MIRRRRATERDVRRVAVLGRDHLPIRLDAPFADDDDRERAELGPDAAGRIEGRASQEHAVGGGDAHLGALWLARLDAEGALKLDLGVQRLHDVVLRIVRMPGPPIRDQPPRPHDDVVERADRRELAFERLAGLEEGDVDAAFHPREA